jgi:hypothetical protein
LYPQDPAPVEPFSNDWPTQGTALRSAQSNPFDDIDDNPDPDPVPLGDNLSWLIIIGVGYALYKNRKQATHK